MKNNYIRLAIVMMLAAFLWGGAVASEQRGSVYVGLNNALAEILLSNSSTTYRVADQGLIFGFMLPIKMSPLDLHYNTRVGLNHVTDILYSSRPSPDDWWYYRNMGHYVSVLNEVLVGRRIDLSGRVYLEPMIGVGFLLHLLYGSTGPGFAYGTFEIGLSAKAMYVLKHIEVGTMLSFQYVPYDGYLSAQGNQYVSAAVVISK
jgi:hypothetical protein